MKTYFLVLLIISFLVRLIGAINGSIIAIKKNKYDNNTAKLIANILGAFVGTCISMSLWVIVYIKLFS